MTEGARLVEIVDYDPKWPAIFASVCDHLRPVLDHVVVAIEHVGSTSVPGLAAKPVIDIDVVIRTRKVLPVIIERLRPLGYEHQGHLGIVDREAFTSPAGFPRHHLYVCSAASPALHNHVTL